MSDLIIRQAAIDVLHGYFDGMLETDTVCPADIYGLFECMPSVQTERKDAVEKAVAVEAISDELMSRFDVSATYGYDFAEAVINRIEAMAKELERGEQE